MPRACPSCGTENPDQARFCFSCATRLNGPSPRRERKYATALFADLVGSTALGEQEDPGVVQSLIGRTFDRLAQVIEAHGGLLEKFMGDGLLALFGAPAAHEDDPERAVRAALQMHAVLSDELNERFAAEGRPRLAMRVGIEAGEVLVDLGRVEGSRDRMITGNAVNTAARLEAAADPGRILVGPAVHASTKEAVDFRELPALTLKGKSEPVPAWEALGPKARRQGERAPLGLEARLVGRDEELAVLKQTLARVRSEGRPVLVTLLGQAGVGKSRLALELLRSPEGRSALWREGRCLAYGGVSYSALAEAVKVQCRILEDDPPETLAEKAALGVEELFGDRELAPHVEVLVGSAQEKSLSREDLFDAWRRFLERMAERSPLVLVLEDVHWADDGLLDFIDHLTDWAAGPILVFTLARPELLERRPTWGGGKRNYSAIYLDPLTPGETEAMLGDLLSVKLPDELTRLVVERSEGNPLFGEEIVRMFIDRGVIRAGEDARWEVAGPVGELEIPRSIQALIAARLDSLPDEEKAILQEAAVVGQAFWLGATVRLSGRTEHDARELLNRLRMKEIVIPREPPAFSGDLEFAFRHVLIRDVAYESLPKSLRADKHVEIARWAEEQAGERREEISELLATHYVEALRYLDELGGGDGRHGDVERAAYRWARFAGERARRLWQQREAVRWFRTALDLAARIDVSIEESASLWESYAGACEEAEPHAEVTRALENALERYDLLGTERDAGRVQARLAWVAFLSGREDEVLPRAESALRRLEPLGESGDLASALHVLGWYEFRRVMYDDAEGHLRRAMDMAERVGDVVTKGHAMVSLAFVFQQTARGQECIAMFEAALELARGAGDLSLRLRAQLHICGAIEEIPGDYRRAEALAREGLELARRAGNQVNVAWMEHMRSDLFLDMGSLDDRPIRDALQTARAVGEVLVVGYALERLAYLDVLRGELEEAGRFLEEVRPIVAESPEPWLQAWPPLVAGHIAQGRGRHEEAARLLADGARPLLDRLLVWGGKHLLLECVRSHARLGRVGEAAPFRDRLAWLASWSVPGRAFLTWADGLLEADDHRAREILRDASAQLEVLEHRIELGRCLVDLAETGARLGEDPEPLLTRAREIFGSSGATLFLREVDAAAAAAGNV